MRGFKLHPNLRNPEFLGEVQTAQFYRLHTIDDVHPGMYRLDEDVLNGKNMPGELYSMEEDVWQVIEVGEPPNLYRGLVQLDDGRGVFGILYPRHLAEGKYPDISEYGGWRAYWASKG